MHIFDQHHGRLDIDEQRERFHDRDLTRYDDQLSGEHNRDQLPRAVGRIFIHPEGDDALCPWLHIGPGHEGKDGPDIHLSASMQRDGQVHSVGIDIPDIRDELWDAVWHARSRRDHISEHNGHKHYQRALVISELHDRDNWVVGAYSQRRQLSPTALSAVHTPIRSRRTRPALTSSPLTPHGCTSTPRPASSRARRSQASTA